MIDVSPYIDTRNKALWEELNSSNYTIRLQESTEPNYGSYCQDKNVIIYVLPSKPSCASFAHELLHVKYHIGGVTAGGCLKRMILQDQVLVDVLTQDTIELIANCMEHVKMLPQFLAMGYANYEFIDDYESSKLSLRELFRFYIRCISNRLYKMDRFIGKYCAMRADNNPAHKYGIVFFFMRLLDKPLFIIVEKFWDEWLQYDTNRHREIWEPDYGILVADFVHSLSKHFAKYKAL